MKVRNIYLLLLLALLLAGCRSHEIDESMSDAEKLELLNLKIDHHPNDASLLAYRAKVLLNLGRANEAKFDIAQAVKQEPKNIDYLMLQADVCFASGDADNSYKALSEAERLNPTDKDIQLKMGELTFYKHDYERSLKHMTNVTEKEPDNLTALTIKAFIYKETGDTASAVTLLRKVCDLHPDYALAFEELGVLYATHHDPLAVEYLDATLRIEPSNTNAMYALAMYYQETGKMEEAEALYRRMLDINEHSADAWHNLGYIELTFYHDYQRAIEYFDKALEADPTHESANDNRQLAQQMLKN
jgi:cytochrome c-type biogenesis protein CcmH/NrfG